VSNDPEKQIEIEALNRIAEQRGIPIEGVSALYAEIKKHVELKDALVDAAIEFIDNDTAENKETLYIARAALRDFEFEAQTK